MTSLAPAVWRPSLRERLVEMRDEMLGRMEKRSSIEPAHLPLIAAIGDTIKQLDQSANGAAAAAVDSAGETIRLILYADGAAVAATELTPVRAIRIGGELLAAAGERLATDLAELRAKTSR